jgi:hypothetical protein
MITVAKTNDDRCRLPRLRHSGLVFAQPPHHIFHVDDRVVDERADRDRHAAERHRIDRRTEPAQHQDRRRQRQRHRRQRDPGGAKVGEEQHDDEDDEHAAVTQRFDHVADRHFDEVGLPEDAPIDGDPAKFLLQRIELAIEPRGDLDRVRSRLLLDPDDHRRFAAPRTLAAFQRGRFAHVGHVAHQHRSRAAQADDAVADFIDTPGPPDRLQHILLRTLGVDTGGRVLARAAHRVQQLRQGDVVGAQRLWMRNDLELPLGAPDRCHLRDAGHRQQPAPDDGIRDRPERQRILGVR